MGVSKDGDLMFSCECDEPKVGKIVRNVYRVDFTPKNLQMIYEKAKNFRTLMGWEILTYEQFLEFFISPSISNQSQFVSKGLCARVDDYVGLFWLTDINYLHPPHDASIHYTFFDRRTKGRTELCRTAIEYIFNTYGFNRLWTQVPLYIKPTREFVKSLGFRQEGRIKKNSEYKGELFDTDLYGLLKTEVVDKSAWTRGDRWLEDHQRELQLAKE